MDEPPTAAPRSTFDSPQMGEWLKTEDWSAAPHRRLRSLTPPRGESGFFLLRVERNPDTRGGIGREDAT